MVLFPTHASLRLYAALSRKVCVLFLGSWWSLVAEAIFRHSWQGRIPYYACLQILLLNGMGMPALWCLLPIAAVLSYTVCLLWDQFNAMQYHVVHANRLRERDIDACLQLPQSHIPNKEARHWGCLAATTCGVYVYMATCCNANHGPRLDGLTAPQRKVRVDASVLLHGGGIYGMLNAQHV